MLSLSLVAGALAQLGAPPLSLLACAQGLESLPLDVDAETEVLECAYRAWAPIPRVLRVSVPGMSKGAGLPRIRRVRQTPSSTNIRTFPRSFHTNLHVEKIRNLELAATSKFGKRTLLGNAHHADRRQQRRPCQVGHDSRPARAHRAIGSI